MEALAARATNRALDPDKSLSQQQLSNMLWAAWGINRPDGRRTAASAMNCQEIDLYLIGKQEPISTTLRNMLLNRLQRVISAAR